MLRDEIAVLQGGALKPLEDASRPATPVRSFLSDDPEEIFGFAIRELDRGGVALATLVEIRGGAARALGSHVAIAADGRFCGYVSGGCVEAAVACEALEALSEGCDREVQFGAGSPFLDIVLPCGGGITVSIHVLRDAQALGKVLTELQQRRTTGLGYNKSTEQLELIEPPLRPGFFSDGFSTVYRPRTQVVISGQGVEAERVAAIAKSSGHEVLAYPPTRGAALDIDEYSAVVLLHHDIDAEQAILQTALHSNAFYIGALGSTRTHRRRVELLGKAGFSKTQIGRIKAPVGIFGPTRDANSLALSILADIVASRLSTFA